MPPAGSLMPHEIAMFLCGGLAIFLYGMDQMAVAMRAAAGDKLRSLLVRLTTNRIKAVLTGTVFTADSPDSAIFFISGGGSSGLISQPPLSLSVMIVKKPLSNNYKGCPPSSVCQPCVFGR